MLESIIPIFKISSLSMLCALVEAATISNIISVLNTNERIFLCFDREKMVEICPSKGKIKRYGCIA